MTHTLICPHPAMGQIVPLMFFNKTGYGIKQFSKVEKPSK